MIAILIGNDFMRVIPRVVDATFDRSNLTATIKIYTLDGESIETAIVKDVTRMKLKDDSAAISIADSRYNMKDASELKASTGVSPFVRPATTEPELKEMSDV